MQYIPIMAGPAEAEKITGLTQVTQRDWRRRGLLPSTFGLSAQYDVVALGTMMFLAAAANRGIGPSQALDIADIAGPAIALYALADCENAWLSPSRGGWGDAVDALRELAPIGSPLRSGVLPARYLIWWANGKETWHHTVDAAIAGLKPAEIEAKLGGPIVVIDQAAMGALLVERAGRPLIRFEKN